MVLLLSLLSHCTASDIRPGLVAMCIYLKQIYDSIIIFIYYFYLLLLLF